MLMQFIFSGTGICVFTNEYMSSTKIYFCVIYFSRDKWVPVTTAWSVLRLRMEERPPDMEGSCEYVE
jgi:hypothetical protein